MDTCIKISQKGGFYDTEEFEIQCHIIFWRYDELHHVT